MDIKELVAEAFFWDAQEYEDGDAIAFERASDGTLVEPHRYSLVATSDVWRIVLTVDNLHDLLVAYVSDDNVDRRDRVIAQALLVNVHPELDEYHGWYADLVEQMGGGFEPNFCDWAAVHYGEEIAS